MKHLTYEDVEQFVLDSGLEDENVILFNNPAYADAFIGMSMDDRAVYDFDKMVDALVEEDGMTKEDAIEYLDYNVIGAHIENSPIVVYPANYLREAC